MSRIDAKFDDLKRTDRKGLIPFVTAGDPNPDTTLAIMLKFAELDAAVIELGVPFSDPMADGPVIQASSQRALERHSITIADVLDIISEFRKQSEVPVVLFGYLNPFLAYGPANLSKNAAAAGVDGILITDLIDDEFQEFSRLFAEDGLDLISLIAPTTSDERLKTILAGAHGFAYAISTTGVTGNSSGIGDKARELVKRARVFKEIPIAVGFGISGPDDVARVWEYADAAVVGSAIVRRIEAAPTDEKAIESVERFVRELMSGDVQSGMAGKLQ